MSPTNFEICYAVFIAYFRIMFLIIIGAILKRKGVISTRKTIAKLLEYLLLPTMIIVNFFKSFDPYDIDSWLPIFILTLVGIISGLILGYLGNKYYGKDPLNNGLITCACSFGVTLNLQLVLVISLEDILEVMTPPYYKKTKAEERGIKYVMLATCATTMVRWTFGKAIMETDNKYAVRDNAKPLVEMKVMKGYDAASHEQKEALAVVQNQEPSMSKFKKTMNEIFTTPLKVISFCIVVCLIPSLKNLLVAENTVIKLVLYDSFKLVSTMINPIMLLQLGASLADPAPSEGITISRKIIFMLAVIKTLICPFFSLINGFIAFRLGWIQDPVLLLLFVINCSTPSAINSLVMLVLKNDKNKDTAKVLTVQWSFALVTLPLLTFAFIRIYTYD